MEAENGFNRRLFQSGSKIEKRNYFDSISFFQLSTPTFVRGNFLKKFLKKILDKKRT